MINSNFQITSHTFTISNLTNKEVLSLSSLSSWKMCNSWKLTSSHVVVAMGFGKNILFVHPNFSTAWMTDSTCLWLTTLKSYSSTILSLYLYERNIHINALLTNEVTSLQSYKIRCVYRPLLAKLVANLRITKIFNVYYSLLHYPTRGLLRRLRPCRTVL